uniref:Uncharacterized protein n=1 Tax=Arundo donax TaxID=35708 RepID=A0A0A9A9T1_ARUDO
MHKYMRTSGNKQEEKLESYFHSNKYRAGYS